MKGRDERKSKISLSDKISLAALLLAVCDFILNWTPSLFRLPRFFLVLIFLALLWSLAVCLRDGWREISRTYSDRGRELHRLCVEAREDEQLLLQYGLQADCLREKYNKRIREQLKRRMKRLAVQTGILLMFSLGNYRPLAAFGQDFLRVCGIGQESSGQPPDELSQEVSQEKGGGIEEAKRENTGEAGQESTGEAEWKNTGETGRESAKEEERNGTEHKSEKERPEEILSRAPKPPDYRFVLEDPDFDQRLEDEIEEQVFFIDHEDGGLDDYVALCMGRITECRYRGVDYRKVRDEDGNGYLTYTAQEDSFKARVDESFKEQYYADWYNNAPRSSEMEIYMKGREQLNMVCVDDRQGCYELWWARANDHQYYAQEFEAQTSNEDAILYHYGMSAYCCMEALKYEMPKEEREMVYHYMVMRYQDMCREEAKIPPTYKERAASVHAVLVKDDPLRDAPPKDDSRKETE
ncbi:hypothetical protein AALB64_05760 [Lachnospiraceae bacterium 45-P1]